MSALFWLWIGGMIPEAVAAWIDRRNGDDAPLAVIALVTVMWPINAISGVWKLMRGYR